MGDSNRHIVFGNFILRNYPRAKSILCVADGKGDLARYLQDAGRDAEVIDPKYNRKYFFRNWEGVTDLIVGLHPDEATAEIIIAGERLGIKYAIVPCCVKGPYADLIRKELGRRFDFDNWIKHLHRLSHNTLKEKHLMMRGANLVLYK